MWAEMSITHRDVHDADVAAVLHRIRQEATIVRAQSEKILRSTSVDSRSQASTVM